MTVVVGSQRDTKINYGRLIHLTLIEVDIR